MSTKVYNGFKFKTTDIFELHQHMMELRKEIAVLEKEKTVELFNEIAVNFIDVGTIHPEKVDKKDSPFMVAFNTFNERQAEIKIRGVRDPSVDFEFSIMVYPFEGELYGMYYTEQSEFADQLTSKPYYESFGYWNNVDPDESVSEEDWKERGRIWNAILDLDESAIPALCGYTYQISLPETFTYPKVQDMFNHGFADFDERVYQQAKNEMYATFFENKKPTSNNVMKLLREFSDYCKTDEGSEKIEQHKKRLSKILKRNITHEMIMGK